MKKPELLAFFAVWKKFVNKKINIACACAYTINKKMNINPCGHPATVAGTDDGGAYHRYKLAKIAKLFSHEHHSTVDMFGVAERTFVDFNAKQNPSTPGHHWEISHVTFFEICLMFCDLYFVTQFNVFVRILKSGVWIASGFEAIIARPTIVGISSWWFAASILLSPIFHVPLLLVVFLLP